MVQELSGQILGLIALVAVLGIVGVVVIAVFRPDQLPVIAELVKSIISRILKRDDSSTKLPVQKRKNDDHKDENAP